jgi:hypothetical protein
MNNHKVFLRASLLCLALVATTSHAAKNDDDDTTEYLPYNEKASQRMVSDQG